MTIVYFRTYDTDPTLRVTRNKPTDDGGTSYEVNLDAMTVTKIQSPKNGWYDSGPGVDPRTHELWKDGHFVGGYSRSSDFPGMTHIYGAGISGLYADGPGGARLLLERLIRE